MKRILPALACSLLLVAASPPPPAQKAAPQAEADRQLSEEVFRVRAVDNHAHPLRATREGEEDREYDALVPDALEAPPLPARLRPDNAEYVGAWRDFWGYRHADMSEAHAREVREARVREARVRGEAYPAWVLDRLNIDVMLANRVVMGRGLVPRRFRWVSFVDALILPLSSERVRGANPDYAAFYPGEDALLRRYLSDLGMKAVPPTLGAYLARVVTPTLERQRRGGAVAVKFEAAYLRALDFGEATEADAARVYARYAVGGAPAAAEYKPLQDFLFRYVAREAGRLGMAVHIHTGNGVGAYFNVNGSDPALLEPALNDPALRKTNFVLVHGGWPFAEAAGALILKPNVYADFSAQTFFRSPHALGRTLRDWLEFAPDKVLFATDAFVLTPEVGWEEVGWLSNRTGREALALALTGMLRDGEITRERASELARMVLRDNAAKLYGIK
ncbi:MAG TPA: amidohydrolase family protein [Pyrinomonadaceae bacterium]|jgi:predicted TIM-barrel fold metal-dependent hydrolase